MHISNKKEVFDWETAVIARIYTEKARKQCLRSFNSFKDREKKAFWWEEVLKKTNELSEINKMILEIEADADMSSKTAYN